MHRPGLLLRGHRRLHLGQRLVKRRNPATQRRHLLLQLEQDARDAVCCDAIGCHVGTGDDRSQEGGVIGGTGGCESGHAHAQGGEKVPLVLGGAGDARGCEACPPQLHVAGLACRGWTPARLCIKGQLFLESVFKVDAMQNYK